MTLTLPNDLANHTPADAAPVQQNYQVIEDYINTDVITRDGRVGMTAPLLLAAGGTTQPLHAATKMYVDAILPVGIILPYGGEVAPAGSWALCNGAPLLVSAYLDLYSVLGFRYGGNGTDTFWLPNMRGRVPIGRDERETGADTRFDHTGDSGGSFVVPVPQHSHPMPHLHTIAHTHEHPHTHPNNHDHVQFDSGPAGAHVHDLEVRINGSAGPTTRPLASSASGTTALAGANVVRAADDHVHPVNVPAYVGNTGQPSDATTGGASNGASGPSSTPNTSNAGVTGTAGELVPPFVVISYIIRIA